MCIFLSYMYYILKYFCTCRIVSTDFICCSIEMCIFLSYYILMYFCTCRFVSTDLICSSIDVCILCSRSLSCDMPPSVLPKSLGAARFCLTSVMQSEKIHNKTILYNISNRMICLLDNKNKIQRC